MTVSGGFPAPGSQDRDPARQAPYAGPQPTGPPVQSPGSMQQVPTLTAHKPGIVPLRPLQLGDILDGAVKAVRFNPKSMVGLSVLVLATFLVPSAALGVGATHLMARAVGSTSPDAQGFVGFVTSGLQLLSTTLATAVLSGLLIHVVGQSVLGRKPDIGETWRATRGRVLSLLGLICLSGLFGVLATAVLLGPAALLLLNNDIAAGVIVGILGIIGLLVVSVFVSTKISLAAPAIVLEGHGVRVGIRRSFALTRGPAFWRVLGITLLAGIIAGFVGYLLGVPLLGVGFVITVMSGPDSQAGTIIVTLVSHLSALLTGAITTPFVAAVTGLLYIDRRMRLEALDVVLLRAAQSTPPPRT
ncbi:MAG: hypothetical protein ABI662_08815 [Dermatophilaceae bacterium]